MSNEASAQYNFHVGFGYSSTPNKRYYKKHVRKEVREFQAFQNKVEKFEYALHDRNLRKAKKLKRSLLVDMRQQIYQTKVKIQQQKRSSKITKKRSRYRRNSVSKRNSNGYRNDLRQLVLLERRLEKQVYVLEEFQYEYLSRTRKSIVRHERLIKQFAKTLRDDISQEKRESNKYYN